MQTLADLAPALRDVLGVVDTGTRDRLSETAAAVLSDLGYPAELAGLHHGVLTLRCDPIVAGLLRYDTDRIVDLLNEQVGGLDVRRIVLHTV